MWLFSKGDDLPLSRNFSSGEFACHCGDRGCHMTLIHPKLVETLQTLRDRMARPLVLTSGFRCKTYNRVVGGRVRSFHTRGMAADVVCASLEDVAELSAMALEIPWVGAVGRYPARFFVHVDVRPRDGAGQSETWIA
ncbi:MAG: D-Ala-D-Ala carboxypeptidase family metallohydrolase [Deltaproteobacteria bacterium]|nr:D-Ala-D-Ala carboxypeptidase family metallohydrolase [Deltaproteobacteria bacterium]